MYQINLWGREYSFQLFNRFPQVFFLRVARLVSCWDIWFFGVFRSQQKDGSFAMDPWDPGIHPSTTWPLGILIDLLHDKINPKGLPGNYCLLMIHYRVVKGGGCPRGGGSLIFPKVPQSSLGILRVPQLPPPLDTPPLGTLQIQGETTQFF